MSAGGSTLHLTNSAPGHFGPRSLKNIARPVEAFLLRWDTESIKPISAASELLPYPATRMNRPPRFSVMVAPFRNLGVSREQEHLADAMTEDLTTDLARPPGSFVVSGAEALRQMGHDANPRDLPRELDVAYVVQGSLRRTAERLGVSAHVIDSGSGAHIWAERFEVDLAGAPDAWTGMTGRLARALFGRLLEDVNRRIKATLPQDWTTYDAAMRGVAFCNRPISQANRTEAIKCFEQALGADPGSVEAWIWIAFVLIGNVADGWSQCAEQDLARAKQLLLDVLQIDSNIFYAHTWMGVLRRLQGRLEEARIELETAIELAPNNPTAIGQFGFTLALLGQPEVAISWIEKNPHFILHDPVLLNDVNQAITCFRKSRAGNPRIWATHLGLAAALAVNDERHEATIALRQGIELRPDIKVLSGLRRLPWHTNPRFVSLFEQTFCAGLRRAGMPDSDPALP